MSKNDSLNKKKLKISNFLKGLFGKYNGMGAGVWRVPKRKKESSREVWSTASRTTMILCTLFKSTAGIVPIPFSKPLQNLAKNPTSSEISVAMRRINGVRVLSRIVSGDATTATTYRRLLRQSAVHGTSTGSDIRCFSQGAYPFGLYYPSFVRNVAGNVRCFSVASSSLVQDVANDLPRPSFVPKDVVLYQYEACPFCNKVKGN